MFPAPAVAAAAPKPPPRKRALAVKLATAKPPRKSAAAAAAASPVASSRPLFDIASPLAGELSATQRPALELILQGRNVFLTGAAGSGKSKLVHVLAQLLAEAETPFAITAVRLHDH